MKNMEIKTHRYVFSQHQNQSRHHHAANAVTVPRNPQTKKVVLSGGYYSTSLNFSAVVGTGENGSIVLPFPRGGGTMLPHSWPSASMAGAKR